MSCNIVHSNVKFINHIQNVSYLQSRNTEGLKFLLSQRRLVKRTTRLDNDHICRHIIDIPRYAW